MDHRNKQQDWTCVTASERANVSFRPTTGSEICVWEEFYFQWTSADVWQSWKIKAISHKSGATDGIIKQSSNGLPTIY